MGSAKKERRTKSTASAPASPAGPPHEVWDANRGAFHFLTSAPPVSLLTYLLPVQTAFFWFAVWLPVQALPLPRRTGEVLGAEPRPGPGDPGAAAGDRPGLRLRASGSAAAGHTDSACIELGGLDEIDTQISQATLGNRENP